MSKAELYVSGLSFILWGLITTSMILAIGIAAQVLGISLGENYALLAVWFGLTLFAGMGFLGGAYLVLRGALRSWPYVPPEPNAEK